MSKIVLIKSFLKDLEKHISTVKKIEEFLFSTWVCDGLEISFKRSIDLNFVTLSFPAKFHV